MVFKLLSDKPLYINIYDNGKIIEKKVFWNIFKLNH